MSEGKNVPKIRFPGFDGEWEELPMSEVFEERIEKNHSEMPVLSVMQGQGTVLRDSSDRNIQYDKANLKNYKLIRKGDYIIHLRSFEGGLECSNYDGISSPAYHILQPEKIIPLAYKGYFRSTDFIKNKLSIAVVGIRDGKNIDMPSFWDIDIPVAGKDEQRKIAEFLTEIDDHICTLERELDKWKELKKGMLQKMFPKEGETVPEIRFPGFSDEWQIYNMGELYIERKEPGNDHLPILTVSIHTGVSDGEQDEETIGKIVRRIEDKSAYKHVHAGDLVFNMMRAWQGAIGSAKNEGMVSPAYITAKPDKRVFPPFLTYYFKRKEMIDQINSLSYGVTDFRKRLYWDSFIQIKCKLPSFEEQKQIADGLNRLEKMTEVAQRELDKWKELKKGLLQQMFV